MGHMLSLVPRAGALFSDAAVTTPSKTKAEMCQCVLAAASRDNVSYLRLYHLNSRDGIAHLRCPTTGSTPLHVAAFNNSIKCVDFLLSVHCDPNMEDGSREVALHLAAKTGALDCLDSLIHTKHIRLDMEDNWGRTPLLKAIIYNKRKAAYKLLAAGCEVNIRDATGLSPLHVAASYGHKNLLNRLIRMGADVNAVDRNGRTPICSAVNGSRFATVLTLLKHGADTTYDSHGVWQQTIVYDAFLKLVHAKSGDDKLNMRVASLVLSAHGRYLPVQEWGDLHVNEKDIDVSQYAAVLKKMEACLKANAHCDTGEFPFKTFFSEKPAVLSLEELCRDSLRQNMMETGRNVVWVCQTLDINPVLKDLILLNNILGY
ncbi:serine/threonine-protein phosphatase 6 regulatory ankyrin repeat subunit C-like [Gigantopelta aegis]|uniref:serine/threonine-protein phosphatase 6 regulatory ankyrin repeat subunit C-like n=1 Tax=Gigantopelta aegis TaxID=1735272 RepID=UPI001B88D879|nr:serine/threonine-protein phosphatase 6 regulatory ankyrin repeat subunit C-like [Gigantopelta aegis]